MYVISNIFLEPSVIVACYGGNVLAVHLCVHVFVFNLLQYISMYRQYLVEGLVRLPQVNSKLISHRRLRYWCMLWRECTCCTFVCTCVYLCFVFA